MAAMVEASGASSCRVSSRFASMVDETILMPVTFPPGRFRLRTSPVATGSAAAMKTMGVVEVAAMAASAGAGPPAAKIAATFRLTRSVITVGKRS